MTPDSMPPYPVPTQQPLTHKNRDMSGIKALILTEGAVSG